MADSIRAATTGGHTLSSSEPEKQSISSPWRAWLSVKDLANRYGAHEATIWRWSREGRFPAPVKLAGNLTRWYLSDVESWENTQRRAI